eukprot:1161596-Pelagomonas_calceolata.AAC.1
MVERSVQSWQRAHTCSTAEKAEEHKPAEVPPHGIRSAFSRLSVNEHHAWTPANKSWQSSPDKIPCLKLASQLLHNCPITSSP